MPKTDDDPDTGQPDCTAKIRMKGINEEQVRQQQEDKCHVKLEVKETILLHAERRNKVLQRRMAKASSPT